jgi:hypothetical protein
MSETNAFRPLPGSAYFCQSAGACLQNSVFRDSHAGAHDARWLYERSRRLAIPAQSLDIPPDDGITYATVDLGETRKVFEKYGVRFLAPEEIAIEIPAFPMRPSR